MNAMDQTIAGAVLERAHLRRRRVHYLRQKDRGVITAFLSDAIQRLR